MPRELSSGRSSLRPIGLALLLLLAAPRMVGALLPQAPEPEDRAAVRKLRVSDPALAARVGRRGGRLLGDYGSYQLFELSGAAAAEIAREPGVELLDEYRYVLLNTGAIDTSSPLARARNSAMSFVGRRLHLVQLVGPTRPEWYQALVDTGVEVVSYVPHNAYLVYGDAASLGALEALSGSSGFVQWSGRYEQSDKIQPGGRARGRRRSAAPEPGLYAIQMVEDPAANPATLQVVESRRRGAVRSRFALLGKQNVIVELDADAVAALAARPDVLSIQPFATPRKSGERQSLIVAGELGGVSPGSGYLNRLAAWGFTQQQFTTSGFAVDVSDSGVDDGTTSPNHFGLYTGGDTSGASRVAYNRLEGSPLFGNVIQGCDGHGTINAHIIAGYDDQSGFPHTDAAGFHFGLGVAPFVRVGSSVIFAPDYIFPDFPDLHSRAYRDGARISSNSWGGLVSGAYDVQAQLFDALTRDAQPPGSAFASPGNQEMVMVVASGNEGPAALRSPGTAKNVITVGASENVHPFPGPDGCAVTDTGADSVEDVADFSSGGPTVDQRNKPDLVAPGTHVSGGVFQTTTPGATGQADSCFDGTGVCGGVGSAFFPAGQELYTASSGTSHSTPAVAGGAALVRQHFVNQALAPPSPAMTKAYLINSARYLSGARAGDDLWSDDQGMGGLDLGAAFDGASRILRDQVPSEIFTASGQTRVVTGVIADPGRPLRVTLAWTDAPGSTTGVAFNNDLDLTVTHGGVTYKGNVFSGAYSATGGSADMRNNAESVFLPAGATGEFAVTVTAANINSDGVPNVGGSLDQDYALVISGGDEVALPVLAPAGAALVAEGCGVGNGALDPGELVTVDLSIANIGLSDAADVVGTLLAAGGVSAPSAPQSFGSLVAGGAAVARPFSFTAQGICGGVVTATLSLTSGGSDLGSASFDFDLGTQILTGPESSFSNPGSVFIDIGGPAAPYPSQIAVSGLTGQVIGVRATLHGLSHAFPDDLDVLLVAPSGESVVLMSDAGGGGALSNVALSFDDAAPTSLTDGGPLVSGTYRPTNWEGSSDDFPPPAPAAGYGGTLTQLAGADPNGTWSLFIVDDFFIDGGSLAGGWSLDITTSTPVCCSGGPAVVVSPISGLETSEAAGSATFTMALTTTPTHDVTVALSSSNPAEGTVAPSSLTFTPADALIAKTVTVTGVDDPLRDGDVAYAVLTAAATSADPAYAGLDPPDVSVTNLDDEPATPLLVASGSTLLLESCAPGNGAVDPGEIVSVDLALLNLGLGDAFNLVATLEATGGVLAPSGPQSYGNLAVGSPAVSRPFSFTVDGTCGGTVTATLALADDYSALGSVSFDFDVGAAAGGGDTAVFSNPALVFIDLGGPAAPYPSEIVVSGATGTVTGVTVTLDGLSHTHPDDLDVLLVAPTGQSVVLMSDGGGASAVVDATLTFDDAAAIALPDSGPLATGSYRPANWEGAADEFDAPAPAEPYGTTLADLVGGSPNGTWSLYVVDDFFVDEGTIARGWSLSLTTTTPSCCVSAPGIVVSPSTGLVTTESGGSASFSVVLATQPTADVVVALSSSDPSEGLVSTGSLTFTPADALTPRTVTVTGVDDGVDDGDVAYSVVTAPAASADPGYAGLDPDDVSLVNADDDVVTIAIGDAVAAEGDSGSTTAVFDVTLSLPSTVAVSVDYATADGTATAGADYVATAGTLSIPAGATTGSVSVSVAGDLLSELDETFFVNLSNPVGGTLGDAQARGTIANDDLPPAISIDDVTVGEGDSGTVDAVFTLSLSAPSGLGVSVGYATADGTAVAGADYVAASGTASFAPGSVTQTVVVGVVGDPDAEPDETFFVDLSGASGAQVADGRGQATIANDDAPLVAEPVVWTDDVGVLVSGNSLQKTASAGWGNAGAVSAQVITSGSGFVELTVSEAAGYRMLGLGNGSAGQSFLEIDYAVYLSAGTLSVYEEGALRGSFGTYAAGDVLRVALQGGVVSYSRNGVVFYTSGVAPVYPLLVDTALFSTGARLSDVMIAGGEPAPPPPPPPPPPAGVEDVVWTDAVGVLVTGNSLEKTAGAGWGNAGAVSAQVITAGSAFVEMTAAETAGYRMLGLSHGSVSQSFVEIDFAVYLSAGSLSVYEEGALRGSFGSFVTGDRIRVAVESGVVSYSRNGAVFYTSGVAPVYPLLVDTALYSQGARLSDVVIAGGEPAPPPPPPPPPPAGAEDVVWTSDVGVAVTGNSLEKTAGAGWGNAGAVSAQIISSGSGFVEWAASETSSYRMLGLGHGDAGQSFLEIDFALYLNAGTLSVYEEGTLRGSFGSFSPGDLLRVAVDAGVVSYSRNGSVFYTSGVTAAYPLLVDCALYSQGATLTDVVVAGGELPPPPPPPPPPPAGLEEVVWTGDVGVQVSGNSLQKTAPTAWGNAGAVSTQSIASGSGYVELTASETGSYRMLGLSNGDSGQSYGDIDFAVYLSAGALSVYEGGVARGSFGSYSPGDLLRVTVETGVVTYSRNGAVFYTSGVTAAYPLLVDTALYSQGATLSDVWVTATP